ncbi:MAG: dicarboxylate/amino acid:cation symporter [Mailhella sp.]|nr:dicarboxylate/amino acid:cation symporter [Mailhella sp.]
MLLALFAGCICGLVVPHLGIDPSYFKPLGDIFINLIKMLVVPLVFATLVAGAAAVGDVSRLGKIAIKSLIYYTVTTVFAVSIGLIVANILQPGNGVEISQNASNTISVAPPSLLSVFMGIIPTNPVKSMTDGNMLQIIFFAVFLGVAISSLGSKHNHIHQFFDSLAEAMLKLTSMVMMYAPIGVFGLLTYTVGTYGAEVLLPLLKLIMVMFIACIIHVCVIYLPCIKYSGVPLKKFFKELTSTILVAFSSASSAAALSSNLQSVQRLGASRPVSSFLIPLGNTINMDGTAIYMGVCSIFAATFFGIDLTFDKQILIVIIAMLASVGTMGVPGAGVIMISMVFTQVGIPLEAIALIAGIDRVLDMMRTTLNVLGDATGALTVSKAENDMHPIQE